MGLMLVTFSMIDIMRENADAGDPEGEEEDEEEEGAGDEPAEGDEDVVKEPKEDKTTIKYILINCHLF